MTLENPLRILISGGGLSGLCLAHGLLGDGHDVVVLERDDDYQQRSGYMLSINGDGGAALERCLPPDLFELYAQTSSRTTDRRGSVVITDQLHELSSMPHLGSPNDGERPHTAVHRKTLRQILQAHLGDHLVSGAEVVSYVESPDGVSVTTADGRTFEGDLLVGADGIRSVIRAQKLPHATVIEAGIDGIGVFGRSPLTDELLAEIPPILVDDVTIAADRAGHRLLLGPFRPRASVEDATSRVAPDVQLDPVGDYVMVSASVAEGTTVPPSREWTADTPAMIRTSMLTALDGWHPALRGLIERVDLDSLFMIPFGRLEPEPAWESSRVTLIGDAAHAMLPTLGMGANLALSDAARLVDELRDVPREALVAAVARAEEGMRDYVYPFMRMTVDHDANFGGGGLKAMSEH